MGDFGGLFRQGDFRNQLQEQARHPETARSRKTGGIDVVLCTATDRQSRDSEHSHRIHQVLCHHRVEFHTSQSGKVSALEFGLRATISQDFIAQTAAKTRDGMRHVVRQGRLAGGLSYGYRVKAL